MPAHGSIIQALLAVLLLILSAYGAGRVHEWYRHGLDRDAAFREGYDRASLTLFSVVARGGRSAPPEPAPKHRNRGRT